MGYNGTPTGMDNCCEDEDNVTKPSVLHAEMNSIIKAAKTGNSVEGSTLYITLSPCVDCSKYILQSGIKRVVYLEEYRDPSGIELLKKFIKIEKHEQIN
jgi:dCMP deaminase